ncbi:MULTISPECIES: OadG family protein [Kosmotoga]|uniref:Sodium pump decarboxylase gamma subunit n=1 Tax=Kosmotoga olearia (strain ATCC BAA-1733 / DSM 21960 / TBF 19.5.1) TaxID=521045 RepID=C5CDP9_KOSOT|nr:MULTISPECIES: OadG family protein [Kosmotoga]ACR80061.1 hypothetical protein Kole_1367 [Kosmotoga olearia TBF 19.5.1]MDI3524288.1 glutaconyl-CoA/methylmalonyl-CoA decarboxylase subunit delta [Kosmotoga sp.]MDK2954134.1 glutaconyl-CoA/methylmalonyl-CoA decarboxylase subunit delta [Kosmotoga sp.]OAA20499.1 hypothetical protein DU53_07540 [Kosmotoga sp. DU53]
MDLTVGQVTLIGLSVVFLTFVILYVFFVSMGKILSPAKKSRPMLRESYKVSPEEMKYERERIMKSEQPEELVAAITAAITTIIESDRFIIRSIKPSRKLRSSWKSRKPMTQWKPRRSKKC